MRTGALIVLVVAACALGAVRARADGLGDECARSFPERLEDARRALLQWSDWTDEAKAAQPKIEWFEGHCRFLDELERVKRKADDPNAFVCDKSKAPGSPRAIRDLVLKYQVAPTVGTFQKRHGDNYTCEERDKAERIPLTFGADPGPARQLEVFCYGDKSERCERARAAQAAAKATAP